MGEGSSWGADWAQARKKNLDIIKKFQTLCKSLGRNLVLISHAKSTVITDGKSQLGPDLPKGLSYALTASAVSAKSLYSIAHAKKQKGLSADAHHVSSIGLLAHAIILSVLSFII